MAERSEQLTITFPPLAAQLEGDTWNPTGGLTTIPYERKIPTASTISAWYMEQTIDLAGFFQDEDMVLIPESYLVQDPGFYVCRTADDNYTGTKGLFTIIEIVSTRSLNMQTTIDDIVLKGTYPGYSLSQYDKQQIVMGESREFQPTQPGYDPLGALSNTPGLSVLNRQSSFGFTEYIGVNRIFIYRIMIPYIDGDGDNFFAPGARIRLNVSVDKVKDREYIYALKRNIELAQ